MDKWTNPMISWQFVKDTKMWNIFFTILFPVEAKIIDILVAVCIEATVEA